MIKTLLILFQVIWIYKLQTKVKDLEDEIKAYEKICKKYAGYFGARESLIILSKIENSLNNEDQDFG